jgi:hypothetical protein
MTVQFGSLPHWCCSRNLWGVKAISNKELLLFAKAKFTDHEQFVTIWDFIEFACSNGLNILTRKRGGILCLLLRNRRDLTSMPSKVNILLAPVAS